jgi:hypothetical protein
MTLTEADVQRGPETFLIRPYNVSDKLQGNLVLALLFSLQSEYQVGLSASSHC